MPEKRVSVIKVYTDPHYQMENSRIGPTFGGLGVNLQFQHHLAFSAPAIVNKSK